MLKISALKVTIKITAGIVTTVFFVITLLISPPEGATTLSMTAFSITPNALMLSMA
jgi:hypothetical protein